MNATLAALNRLTGDPTSPDGALLKAFLGGDQAAFAALVRRHSGLVLAACRRVLRHQQDTEDAFQATFLVLARRAADVWPREAVGPWLFGVAHRVALKARAVRAKRLARERPLEDGPSAANPPPDGDVAEAVQRVVAKLPDVYRAAVVACDLQGLSRKDAAARLGWTEGTLSGRLARARGLLAKRLGRLGFAPPAGGLVALAATPETVSASFVQVTIRLASGTAAGVSAPVAALTYGVVRNMALFKLKAMAAVVLAACALGFGAYTASGSGDGQQPQTQTQGEKAAPKPAKPPGPRTDLARRELEVLLQELDFAAVARKWDAGAVNRLRGRLQAAGRLLDPNDLALDAKRPAKSLTDSDRLQGSWRVVAVSANGKTAPANPKEPWVVEVASRVIQIPYQQREGWTQREYVFDVNEAQSPRQIDLVRPNDPAARGIYEFTAPATACVKCHDGKSGLKLLPLPGAIGLCGFCLKTTQLGLRLALSTDGKRPTTFGGEGVIVFEMVRAGTKEDRAPGRWVGKPNVWQKFDATDAELQLMLANIEHNLRGEKIDPQFAEQLRLRLEHARWMLDESRKASGIDSPADPAAKAALDLHRAEREAELAQALLEKVKAGAELTPPQLAYLAEAQAARARQALAAAKKAAAGLKTPAPAKEGEAFTVHVRTLTAAENVIRVPLTGKQKVSDALAAVSGNLPASPAKLEVWRVRGDSITRVELEKGRQVEKDDDIALQAGDRLFVQVKPAK